MFVQEGYDVFTVGHPAVAVELKIAWPIDCPLSRTLSVAHKNNQVNVYFILSSPCINYVH